jgi:hypothetical protein
MVANQRIEATQHVADQVSSHYKNIYNQKPIITTTTTTYESSTSSGAPGSRHTRSARSPPPDHTRSNPTPIKLHTQPYVVVVVVVVWITEFTLKTNVQTGYDVCEL